MQHRLSLKREGISDSGRVNARSISAKISINGTNDSE